MIQVASFTRPFRTLILQLIDRTTQHLNLIERLWKFLRKNALQKWHPTFEAMQDAVADILDNLPDYKEELRTLMTERFHLVPELPKVA